MDIVKAEPDTFCDICFAPAVVCDLDADGERQPAHFCRDHDPRA